MCTSSTILCMQLIVELYQQVNDWCSYTAYELIACYYIYQYAFISSVRCTPSGVLGELRKRGNLDETSGESSGVLLINNHVLSVSDIIHIYIYVISVSSQYYHTWSIQLSVYIYYNGLPCIVRPKVLSVTYDCTTWTCQWTYNHNDCQRSIYIFSLQCTVHNTVICMNIYIVLSKHTTVQHMNNCHFSCHSRLSLLPCPCPVRVTRSPCSALDSVRRRAISGFPEFTASVDLVK